MTALLGAILAIAIVGFIRLELRIDKIQKSLDD